MRRRIAPVIAGGVLLLLAVTGCGGASTGGSGASAGEMNASFGAVKGAVDGLETAQPGAAQSVDWSSQAVGTTLGSYRVGHRHSAVGGLRPRDLVRRDQLQPHQRHAQQRQRRRLDRRHHAEARPGQGRHHRRRRPDRRVRIHDQRAEDLPCGGRRPPPVLRRCERQLRNARFAHGHHAVRRVRPDERGHREPVRPGAASGRPGAIDAGGQRTALPGDPSHSAFASRSISARTASRTGFPS